MTLLKSILSLIISLFLALTLAFFTLRLLPGNAIDSQLQGSGLAPEVIAARKAAFGLDKPAYLQYLDFLGNILQGDLGISLYTGQTVNEIIGARLPNTLSLASLSMFLAIVLGIGLGVLAGLDFSLITSIARRMIDLSLAIPIYITATILLFLIAPQLGGIQNNLVLPVSILGFHSAGAIARLIASRLIELKTAPFIQTAYAKGLPQNRIILVHMLRLALLPALPIIATQAGFLFSGTVITESIFGRAGLGVLLLDAVLQRNYPVVQGIVILAVTFYLIANSLADILAQWFDPRLRAA